MIEDIPFEDERILGIRISGKVDLMDLLPVIGRVDSLLQGDAPLRGYVEIGDFDGVSLAALARDIKYAVTHFRALAKRFERVAIVTDNAWIRRMAKFESLFIPGLEERVFAAADVVEAQAWVAAER